MDRAGKRYRHYFIIAGDFDTLLIDRSDSTSHTYSRHPKQETVVFFRAQFGKSFSGWSVTILSFGTGWQTILKIVLISFYPLIIVIYIAFLFLRAIFNA